MTERIRQKLFSLYGDEQGAAAYRRLMATLDAARNTPQDRSGIDPAGRVSERDVMLITYGDSIQDPGTPPLQVLHRFLQKRLAGVISAVHLLPFFPYSSDDGFSIIDYQAVNSAMGDWPNIQQLGGDFKLMFDAVINHISAQSDWFKRYCAGDAAYDNFFIDVAPDTDLSSVVRPRSLPLLTPFETASGTRHIWTTFSADQVDLNFANPDVLLRIIDVLLFYVRQGMAFIRLDAIAYLWKIPGTSSIHLEQTHTVVKLFRDVLDYVAPQVAIITETNVPHAENVSYFGAGDDEAQLVYQFSLPPLALHAIAQGDASVLSQWAASLTTPSDQTTFFNFTASHDGIGVRPAEGLLSTAEIEALVQRARAHGGDVSYKTNSDGTQSPYELNINYFDALSDPQGGEPLAVQAARFMVSQAIALAFMGMPGIYVHSLLGSRNWNAGVQQTGRLRTINREKLQAAELEAALDDAGSLRARVFEAYRHLITVRTAERAFHPNAPQEVLQLHPALFTLLRTTPDGDERIVAIHNVANHPVPLDVDALPLGKNAHDLISGRAVSGPLELAPYQVAWLKTTGNQL